MIFGSLMTRLSEDLAIDLGTANTLVYKRGRGVVLSEPSVVAVRRDGRGTNKVVAVGNEAKLMLGRTPGNIVAVRPMKDGVIADFDVTEAMLRHFIRKVNNRGRLIKARVIVCVPSGISMVEKRAVREAAEAAGAREVFFIEEPIAAAIGAGLPVTEPVGNMIVDVGGGTTEVAVISLAGVVYSKSVRVGGNMMDDAILHHIKRRYGLLIGESSAEKVKITIGDAVLNDKVQRMEVKGRDLISGIPRIVEVDSAEVNKALSEMLETIVQTVRSGLEQIPPELAGDIVDTGIFLAGGGALLKNLDRLLMEETGLPIRIADDPLTSVVLGSGKALDSEDVFKQLMI